MTLLLKYLTVEDPISGSKRTRASVWNQVRGINTERDTWCSVPQYLVPSLWINSSPNNIKLLHPPHLKLEEIQKQVPNQFLTSLCGVSPLNKDMAAPVIEMAVMAPTRPIPAHKSHPFCRLKGSLTSETTIVNKNSKDSQTVHLDHNLEIDYKKTRYLARCFKI